jgi:NAD(P)-dependent dehydrogenase (short-subunit alcohol dehydrogenase family)
MSAPIYEDVDVRKARGQQVPMGSLGTAEDVAEAVAFLVSDKARYTTGHQLMVDGGVSFSLKNHLPRTAPRVRT